MAVSDIISSLYSQSLSSVSFLCAIYKYINDIKKNFVQQFHAQITREELITYDEAIIMRSIHDQTAYIPVYNLYFLEEYILYMMLFKIVAS
jgi:hypothetical protein